MDKDLIDRMVKDASFAFGHGGQLPTEVTRDLACHVMGLATVVENLQEQLAIAQVQFSVANGRARSYRRALEMIAATRAVCGSGQGTLRSHRMIADAALAEADFMDEETAIKVAEGKWSNPQTQS